MNRVCVSTIISRLQPAHGCLRKAGSFRAAQLIPPIEIVIVLRMIHLTLAGRCCQIRSRRSHHPRQGDSPGQQCPAQLRRGSDEASGAEFIQFLDSERPALPQSFPAQVATLQRRPECGISLRNPVLERIMLFQPPGRDCPMRPHRELIDHLFPRL